MKKVSLNKNSWHYKYYVWVTENYSEPKSLCPYFWTMIVLLVFSPIMIFMKLISLLVDKLIDRNQTKILQLRPEQIEKRNAKINKRDRVIEIIGKVLFGIWIFAGVSIIVKLLAIGISTVGFFQIFQGVLAIFGGCTLLYLFISYWLDNNIGNKILNSGFIKIPVTMIKSIYKKSCPMIEWNDETSKVTN